MNRKTQRMLPVTYVELTAHRVENTKMFFQTQLNRERGWEGHFASSHKSKNRKNNGMNLRKLVQCETNWPRAGQRWDRPFRLTCKEQHLVKVCLPDRNTRGPTGLAGFRTHSYPNRVPFYHRSEDGECFGCFPGGTKWGCDLKCQWGSCICVCHDAAKENTFNNSKYALCERWLF